MQMIKKIRHANKSRSNLTASICYAQRERAYKRERKPLQRQLASFAIALGILLCSPANAHAPKAHWAKPINDKIEAKRYAKGLLSKNQYQCLNALYSKESAWNRSAYNSSGAYGIPQLKNKLIRDMSGPMQVMYGLKYVSHRYDTINGEPNACAAYRHWQKHGWH